LLLLYQYISAVKETSMEEASAKDALDHGDSKEPSKSLPSPKDHAQTLRNFYAQYNISLDALGNKNGEDGYLPHRFVRLHPAFDSGETLKQLKVQTERALLLVET
jgi:hypothetical protein